jgi:hypothetical protein
MFRSSSNSSQDVRVHVRFWSLGILLSSLKIDIFYLSTVMRLIRSFSLLIQTSRAVDRAPFLDVPRKVNSRTAVHVYC